MRYGGVRHAVLRPANNASISLPRLQMQHSMSDFTFYFGVYFQFPEPIRSWPFDTSPSP